MPNANTQQQNTLRNSKRGQEAMPMPAGSGAMLTSKVPVQRPLPCIVIVIHGVNDDGQFFPVVDRHICAGLNKRLGRDDLFPHKWGTWKEGSETTVPELATSTTIIQEGRSPVIPFHWGYRPVERETYLKDQRRYQAQLDASNRNPDLPYSSFSRDLHHDAKKGYSKQDNLGNWLNDHFAKDGGPFPNATTNLVDMWGPGPGGASYGFAAGGADTFGDSSAPMYENPHRIYYVHAARRLADLILKIRTDPQAGPDTINIVAHSQGTEIAMLASFLVSEAGRQPADCLILCDSPYGLDPTEAELRLPGKHQSREARVETLANFTRIMREKRRSVDKHRIVVTGVAKAEAWAHETHSRDNAGRVYNYFCPQDSVVSLPNIQGMGWKGVDSEAMKALGQNFVQRVFSNGHIVGKGKELFRVADGPHTKVAGFIGVHDGDRVINGDSLPEPYAFQTLTGTDRLGEHLAGTALAKEGAHTVYRLVDIKTAAESSSPVGYPTDGKVPADVSQIQSSLNAVGYTKQIVEAWYLGVPVNNTSRYLIRRYETQDEALSRLGQRESAWSQHSAILLHHETIEKCIAYDLAIGLTVAFDANGGEIWWELLQQADWRNPKNPDRNAASYYKSGELPDPIKRQMNKPILPAGVVNSFATDYVGAFAMATVPGAISKIKDAISTPRGGTGQWPLPEPDLRG